MSYKFNRDCWVESLEESLFCSDADVQLEAGEGEHEGRRLKDSAREKSRTIEPAGPSAIERLIIGAEKLFAELGDKLKNDERIGALIQRLETNLENSRQGMHELGIFPACARCDATAPEGSCCSRGLEKKYGSILLVMNLILGVSLPQRRLRADSCYFLGQEGCGLKVRHMLCIDYLCPELEKALGREGLIRIQTLSGEEIETAFLLREAVKDRILRLLE